MRINLTDNNIGQVKAGTFLRKDVSALFPIADKTIAQLCHENENLLVFPFSIEDSDDKVGETIRESRRALPRSRHLRRSDRPD